MNRRDFCRRSSALASAGLALAGPVRAQPGKPVQPVEGTQYIKLGQPVQGGAAGKVEVIEFFWYGSPPCNALEPALELWVRRLPPDVHFWRSPVAFSALHATHARVYYTLEILGKAQAMHRKVFAAIHNDRKHLDQEADIVAFMAANGIDAAAFRAAFDSAAVHAKVKQGQRWSELYRIDGVPALGVQGRFYTSPALAGGDEKALAVADYLIGLARKPA